MKKQTGGRKWYCPMCGTPNTAKGREPKCVRCGFVVEEFGKAPRIKMPRPTRREAGARKRTETRSGLEWVQIIVVIAIISAAGVYLAAKVYERIQASAGTSSPRGTLQAYVDGYNARSVDKVYGLFSSRARVYRSTVEYAMTRADLASVRITSWGVQEENVAENTAVLKVRIAYSYSIPYLMSGTKTESVRLPMTLENGRWLIDNSKLIDLPLL